MSDNKKTTPTAIVVAKETDEHSVSQLPATTQEFNPQKQVEQATQAAQALMSVISQKKKPVKFNDEQYLEFEDWQTIAQFYSHTVGVEWTKPIEEAGKVIGFEAKANLYNREGLIVGGAEAACMKDEPNWAKKPLFQLRSMAQTRASAKALRSRFGFVAVLAGFKPTPAEEMQDVFEKPVVQTPAEYWCSVHDELLTIQPAGVTKEGKEYKAFWKCSQKVNGKFCKGPFVNDEGVRVRQNPETGEMMPDKTEQDINEIVPGIPPINTFQKTLDGINSSNTEKELDGWADNLKFVKKMVTIKQYADLRMAIKQKREGLNGDDLAESAKKVFQIDQGDIPA